LERGFKISTVTTNDDRQTIFKTTSASIRIRLPSPPLRKSQKPKVEDAKNKTAASKKARTDAKQQNECLKRSYTIIM
jgi:hypothetical protein